MNNQKENFIANIEQSDLEEVKKYLEKNPQTKQIYDAENVSVVMISLKTLLVEEELLQSAFDSGDDTDLIASMKDKQIQIYEALISHGFNTSPNEDGSVFAGKLDLVTRIKMRKIQKKNAVCKLESFD